MPGGRGQGVLVVRDRLAGRVAGLSVRGDSAVAAGGGARRQPALPRSAGRWGCPGDMMIDRVSPPAGMRPLSLIRPSAGPWAGLAAADSGLAGAGRGGPHRVSRGCRSCPSSACLGRGHRGRVRRSQAAVSASSPSSARMWRACRTILRASDSAARLPSYAVLDLGVVARGPGRRGAGVGLAGLVDGPAQHRRSLPGQPPGGAFAVGGVHGDVQPGEPDRLAGGGEPARAAQPAGQRQRGDRPDPVEPCGQHLGARSGGGRSCQQLVAQPASWASAAREHVQGGGDLQLPGRRQVRGGERPAARPGPARVRSTPSPSGGAPWWNSTAWMRCTQAVCSRRRSW